MNIYLVSQSVNNSYDTYDSMVVIAVTEERTKELTTITHPHSNPWGGWAKYEDLICELVGIALEGAEEKIILESFNAG